MKRFFKRCDERPIELTSAEITLNPDKVIDLLANLAQRVAELERKLGEYSRKVDGMEADIQNINVDLGLIELAKAVKRVE
jgi:hypothetical protein